MELINGLQQIGLSRREAEAYLALLQKKEFTAPELSRITTITRTKIYEILQNLIRKGVCNESFKDGQKVYRGIKPQIALQNIISNYQKEIEQKKNIEIEQKKHAAALLEDQLITLYSSNLDSSEPLDYIEILSDVGQIRERWNNFQKNTKKEILVFTKPPYTASLEDNLEVQSEALEKNKIIDKCIYEYSGLSDKEVINLVKIVEAYERIGEESRIIKELPMKLAISDETITMLALNDRVSLIPGITTIIVDHPNFAKAQKAVFETYWEKALPVEEFKKNKITSLN
jgi:sugar-specific transcriptional regulator TrmB